MMSRSNSRDMPLPATSPETRDAEFMIRLFPKKKIRVTLPENTRVIAVGDIHGQLNRLVKVLALVDRYRLANPVTNDHLVFLGDYTDRGAGSAEVIELLASRRLKNTKQAHTETFLRGNHEVLVQEALTQTGTRGDLWWRNGGLYTVSSYLQYQKIEIPINASNEDLLKLFRDHYPKKHTDFMSSLQDNVKIGPIVCVHAGLKMDVELEEQSQEDMHWIRDPFLHWKGDQKDFLVVHGHTITPKYRPVIRDHRVGIDTGSYKRGGRITAAIFEKNHVNFLSNGTKKDFEMTPFS